MSLGESAVLSSILIEADERNSSCPEYVLATNTRMALPICVHPLAEYFWYNAYHPSPAIHRLLAQSIKSTMLTLSTNVAPSPPPIVSPFATLTIPAVPLPTRTGSIGTNSSTASKGISVGMWLLVMGIWEAVV